MLLPLTVVQSPPWLQTTETEEVAKKEEQTAVPPWLQTEATETSTEAVPPWLQTETPQEPVEEKSFCGHAFMAPES
jgi:hypothetical protein